MRKPVAPEQIASAILVLRGQRVLLDAELAALYGVTTKRLNEQVKRNAARFPADFIFRLTKTETVALNRSQNATGSQKHRDPRFAPYAFTEHGAIMAATILSSRAPSKLASTWCAPSSSCARCLRRTGNWLVASHNSKPGSTKSSPPMMKPSPPSYRPSASSCTLPSRSAGLSASPRIFARRCSVSRDDGICVTTAAECLSQCFIPIRRTELAHAR